MLESMLLLAEVILLLATVYVYWMTRQQVSSASMASPGAVQAQELTTDCQAQTASPAANVETVCDVADLLAELQSAASDVRDDWTSQNASLQETLNKAETTVAELRTLLTQAETIPALSTLAHPAPGEVNGKAAPGETEESGTSSLTLADAITAFGEHLRASGRSRSTVTRSEGHIRGFATWLGGQRYDQLVLKRVDDTEIEAYIQHLTTLNYQPETIKRKLAALKAFTSWTDALAGTGTLAGTSVPVPSRPGQAAAGQGSWRGPMQAAATAKTRVAGSATSSLSPSYVGVLSGANCRRTVFALANQGLDRQTISARTGLEQEAVRLLLTMKRRT